MEFISLAHSLNLIKPNQASLDPALQICVICHHSVLNSTVYSYLACHIPSSLASQDHGEIQSWAHVSCNGRGVGLIESRIAKWKEQPLKSGRFGFES